MTWHTAQACAVSHRCQNLFLRSHAVGCLVISTLGAPLLVGLFWGAPLVAAESEAGTTHFAWMQSITRRRWLAVKVGWMVLAAVVWGGVISALVTWWEGPDNALQLDAFDNGRFDIMGIVPVAYSLFALALGITAGALVRQVLPAMAVTLGGFVVVRATAALYLRRHYLSPVTVYIPVTRSSTPPGSYWSLASGVLGPNGLRIDQGTNGTWSTAFRPPTSRRRAIRRPEVPSLPPASCTQALAHFRGLSGGTPGGPFGRKARRWWR
jgi:hypothetical protein